MENGQVRVQTSGLNLVTAVQVLFLGLKLAGIGQVADWSWWWVLMPIWVPFAGLLAFLGGWAIGVLTKDAWDAYRRNRRRKMVQRRTKEAKVAETKAVDAAMEADRKLRRGDYGNMR